MPKIKYQNIHLRQSTLERIKDANDIINEYAAQGFLLTVRQLYYKFIARDLFPPDWFDKEENSFNTIRNYKRLVKIMSDARMSGRTDWEAIEDRTRNVQRLSHWSSPYEIMNSVTMQYLRDRWEGQDYYIEVWIEKDALTGVIDRVCCLHDIPYFSCRGYTSLSELWRTARRLNEMKIINGQDPVIIHLGDHDPSGLDMTRDIKKRFDTFGCQCKVKRIALNYSQVKKYKPPPNFAKVKDSRYKKYVNEFGQDCWELDALEPSIIEGLIDMEVKKYINIDILEMTKKQEEKERIKLWHATEDLK